MDLEICETILEGHNNKVISIDFSPDGDKILSGSSDKTTKIWDLKSGLCEKTFEEHTESVYSVLFLDSDKIASASGD